MSVSPCQSVAQPKTTSRLVLTRTNLHVHLAKALSNYFKILYFSFIKLIWKWFKKIVFSHCAKTSRNVHIPSHKPSNYFVSNDLIQYGSCNRLANIISRVERKNYKCQTNGELYVQIFGCPLVNSCLPQFRNLYFQLILYWLKLSYGMNQK